MILAAAAAWLATGAFVRVAIARGWGKRPRADGPSSHLAKTGTPTLGGVAFLPVALIVALLADSSPLAWAAAGLVVASTAIGLVDDAAGLRRAASGDPNPSLGLLARHKLALQGTVALAFSVLAVQSGIATTGLPLADVALYTFAIVATVNAINFTDGLDGLAAGVTAIALLPFHALPLASATTGACIGFLWFNTRPARIMMGDSGSHGLGAVLAASAILTGNVWFLPLVALVPVAAVLSVVAQVIYFRATGGRRLLKMSPFHHHLELSGWPEEKVTVRLWIVTAVAAAAAWTFLQGARV